MENKGVSIYSIDAECNKMTIHLDEIKKVCDEKKLLEDRIAKVIEILEEPNYEYTSRTEYFEIVSRAKEILKGDKE